MTVREAMRQIADVRARARGLHVDPRAFADPVALRTEWTPMFGAAGIAPKLGRTRLHEDASRVTLRRTLPPAYLLLFFGPAALIVASLAAAGSLAGALTALADLAVFAAGAIAWGALAVWLLRPAVFDRAHGAYWRGWKAPAHPHAGARLNEIHALQLLHYQAGGGKSPSFPAYQLNLVLRDGRRFAVASATDRDALRGDAYRLQRFLGAKLWDATAPATGAASATARVAANPLAVARVGANPAVARVSANAAKAAMRQPERVPERRTTAASGAAAALIGLVVGVLLLSNEVVFKTLTAKYLELTEGPATPRSTARSADPAPAPAPAPAPSPADHATPIDPVVVAAPSPSAPEIPPASVAPESSGPVPDACSGLPVTFLARCTAAQADGHPCHGRMRGAMVECLVRHPEPAGLASCAQQPLEQRAPCAFQYFLEQTCRGESTFAAMEACWARERARLGVPG